jgi:hypothetical protein
VLHGTLTEKMQDGNAEFSTVQVPPDLASALAKHGVEYSSVP